MRVALAVATCFSLLISSADAFASVKSSTTTQFGSLFNNNVVNSSNKSTSSSSLSATAAVSLSLLPVLVAPPTYTLFGLNIKKEVRAKKQKQQPPPPLFFVPSIFNKSDSRPIILFDGKCNLCNAGVQLILDNDRASSDPRGNLRVAALQSKVGQLLLSRLSQEDMAKVQSFHDDDGRRSGGGGGGGGVKEYKSIVVAGDQVTWFNSAACIRIGRDLRGPLRYLAILASLIPSFIRDPLYKLLSKHRKKLFGESAECRLWDENYDMRFVDDGVLTGVYRDPFADPNASPVEVEEEEYSSSGSGGGSSSVMDLTVGPNVNVGDTVRVISTPTSSLNEEPIVHTHVVMGGYENNNNSGVCSVGLVGKVVRVLEQRAYPKNVVVQFDSVDCGGGGGEEDDNDDAGSSSSSSSSGSLSFVAHFFPGQLRKE